nr:hypothetical protein CFP56_00986 [Quercus suber]
MPSLYRTEGSLGDSHRHHCLCGGSDWLSAVGSVRWRRAVHIGVLYDISMKILAVKIFVFLFPLGSVNCSLDNYLRMLASKTDLLLRIGHGIPLFADQPRAVGYADVGKVTRGISLERELHIRRPGTLRLSSVLDPGPIRWATLRRGELPVEYVASVVRSFDLCGRVCLHPSFVLGDTRFFPSAINVVPVLNNVSRSTTGSLTGTTSNIYLDFGRCHGPPHGRVGVCDFFRSLEYGSTIGLVAVKLPDPFRSEGEERTAHVYMRRIQCNLLPLGNLRFLSLDLVLLCPNLSPLCFDLHLLGRQFFHGLLLRRDILCGRSSAFPLRFRCGSLFCRAVRTCGRGRGLPRGAFHRTFDRLRGLAHRCSGTTRCRVLSDSSANENAGKLAGRGLAGNASGRSHAQRKGDLPAEHPATAV